MSSKYIIYLNIPKLSRFLRSNLEKEIDLSLKVGRPKRKCILAFVLFFFVVQISYLIKFAAVFFSLKRRFYVGSGVVSRLVIH